MDIREIGGSTAVKLSASKQQKPSDVFEQIYNQKLAAVSKTELPTQLDAKQGLIDQSNRVLDLLDEYVQELRNPEKSLKEIDPLIQIIQKEVDLVEAKASDPLVAGDDGIEGLVQDLTVTANVALLKFHRGDFI